MKLTPNIIRQLSEAARLYGDDDFFGVRSEEQTFFVCNWVFGLSFKPGEVLNCPHVQTLEQETERICALSPTKKDIIRHIYHRSWIDILVGAGIYQDATPVHLRQDEQHIFRKRGWRVLPFETDIGRRYYIRERYFDIAESIIGNALNPVIFRPISTPNYPQDYRPMLFVDGSGETRGLVYAISEENMKHPINTVEKYSRLIEEAMPEMLR